MAWKRPGERRPSVNAPLAVFVILGVGALGAFVGRVHARWACAAAALSALGAGVVAIGIPLDEPMQLWRFSIKIDAAWRVLGRTFAMDAANQAMVGFLLLAGAYVLGGTWIARAGKLMPSAGLLVLAGLAGALLIQPFLFAALFIVMAALGAGLILANQREPGNQRAALRMIALSVLAGLALLIAGWFLDLGPLPSVEAGTARRVTLLLILGFAVLVAIPPFHIWLANAGDGSHPYGFVFVVIAFQSVGIFLMLRFLNQYPWLRENSALFEWMSWVGVGVILLGSGWALGAGGPGKAVAYLLVADIGAVLLAVSRNAEAGYQLAFAITAVRVFSLAVWALGTSVLSSGHGGFGVGADGAGTRGSLASAAMIVGVLSLGGFPLTAGFPARWALLELFAESGTGAILGLALIMPTAAATAIALRLAEKAIGGREVGRHEPIGVRIFLGVGILTSILQGVFPQMIFPWITDVVRGLSNLFPG